MTPYEGTLGVIGLMIAGAILFLVRRRHLHGPYALWWLGVSVAILVLSLLPQWVYQTAYQLGIPYPPVLPVLVGIGFLLIKILAMDIERSRRELIIRRLTQRLGILDAEITQLKQDIRQISLATMAAPRSGTNAQAGEPPTGTGRENER